MAITTAQQTNVLKIVTGLFNAAPGGANLTYITNMVEGGTTMVQLADLLAATSTFTSGVMVGKDTTASQVTVLMNNFGLVADSDPASAGSQAQEFFTARINAGVGFGAIVNEAVNFLSQSSTTLPAEFTTAATLLSNKAAVAAAYSAANSGAGASLSTLQNVLSTVTGTAIYTDAQVAAILAASGSTTTGSTITGTAQADVLAGGAGNDILSGLAGDDTINGGAGDDSITGGTGADILTGGAGVDTFVFNATVGANTTGVTTGEVITDFVVGTDKLQFAGVTAVASGQQAAVQAAVTALVGATATQIAAAMAATNTTNLGASFAVYGGDTYVYYQTTGGAAASAANDVFIKLTGVASGFTFGTAVVDNVAVPATTVNLTVADDTYTTPGDGNFIINGLGGNDTITTGAGNNTVITLAGNDTITTGVGNDTIDAGAGNNTITAGAGTNTITVGAGIDTITGGIGNDTIIMGANLTGSDTVTGGAGAGTDILRVSGTLVDAAFAIVSGIETLDLAAASNVTLATAAQTAGIVTVTNSGNGGVTVAASAYTVALSVTGGAGNDTITTGTGNDTIAAGNGTNSITGGTGKDSMSGGTGVDTYNFATVTDTVAAAGSIAGVDSITNLTLNAAAADLINTTVTVAAVGTAVTGALTEATFVANMNTLLTTATKGFVTNAVGIDAAVIAGTSGDLSGRTFLAIDLDANDIFTAADFVIEITGATLTSVTTASFV